MSINHSAEYMVLWKSHKRAEWEAVRLKKEADALRQQAGQPSARPGQAPGSRATALVEAPAETREDLEVVAQQLEEESRRKGELCSEIGAELDRVAAALTAAQRKDAEKVLKQWESAELEGMRG